MRCIALMVTVTVTVLDLSGGAVGAESRQKSWVAPKNADSSPDLQGVWTNATITPLERAQEYGQRRALTDAEAGDLERRQARTVERGAAPSDLTRELPPAGDGVGGYNNFWIDRGSKVAVVDGEKRSSLIVDPPDGRMPQIRLDRRTRLAGAPVARGRNFDGPESRPLGERCLLAFGSSSGPPMLPVLYNNHYQIVQAHDTVTILVEMVHDARVIRLSSEHLPNSIRKWMGDSIGRYEGNTLIIETTNFTGKESFRGTSLDRKVTERLTRTAQGTINYRVTIEDATLTQPVTAEYPFYLTDDRIYEYACHEGNYALPGILAGAREEERAIKR